MADNVTDMAMTGYSSERSPEKTGYITIANNVLNEQESQ
jgi:hypothetical protein